MKISRLSKAWIGVGVSLVIPAAVIVISLGTAVIPEYVYIPSLVSLLGLLISFIYWEFGEDLEAILDNTRHGAQIRPIREPDFYDWFRADVEEANNVVWITYFDNKDPTKRTDSEKRKYYQEIEDIIKRKSPAGVEFKRIVRGIPQIDDWVNKMIDNMEGVSRYSIACLPDEEPDVRSKPHISVQIIDDDISYFVAVGEQEQSGEPRDLRVESKQLNSQWKRYYQRLWANSYVVFRRGAVQEQEMAKYQAHLDSVGNSD